MLRWRMIHVVVPVPEDAPAQTGYTEIEAATALEAIQKWQETSDAKWDLIDMEVAC